MRTILLILAIVVGLALSGCGDGSSRAVGSITAMAKQGASDAEMIDAVERNPERFALTESDVIALHKDGVHDEVVVAMLRHRRK